MRLLYNLKGVLLTVLYQSIWPTLITSPINTKIFPLNANINLIQYYSTKNKHSVGICNSLI